MRFRSLLIGAAAVAGVSLAPAPAHAVSGPPAGPCLGLSAQLGLGGYLSSTLGCWPTILAQGFYKNAYDWSTLSVFNNTESVGNPGLPGGPETLLGNNLNGFATVPCGGFFSGGCGNNGYILGSNATMPSFTPTGTGELVFDLFNQSAPDSYHGYSGNNARNTTPAPPGLQEILVLVNNYTGGTTGAGSGYQTLGSGGSDQYFLLAWEDINDGCNGGFLAGRQSVDWSQIQPYTNGGTLDNGFTVFGCTPTGADNDFNDFFVLLDVQGGGVTTSITPEPMTMSLMAFGLVAMGGASLRRRKKNTEI